MYSIDIDRASFKRCVAQSVIYIYFYVLLYGESSKEKIDPIGLRPSLDVYIVCPFVLNKSNERQSLKQVS